jgi:hypothetical protein
MKTGLNKVMLSTLQPIQAQQYCAMLFTTMNNVAKTNLWVAITSFTSVTLQAHNFGCVVLAYQTAVFSTKAPADTP